jgi:5-methylcytosine-specific restriction protein A
MIDLNKIVFITVDWMKYYKGITEEDIPLGTGGSYPKEKKHEIFNFLDDNGTCYGYTPPYGRINLKEICKSEIKKDPDGNEYIENVLIVFNASKDDGKKRRVIGFYVGAKIYKSPYPSSNSKRINSSENLYASYNILVKSENVYLFDNENKRDLYLPFSKKDGYGYGQSNIWYANKDSRSKIFKNGLVVQLEKVINENNIDSTSNDEQKYFEGQLKSKVKEVFSMRRSAFARKKCLEYYFPNNKNFKCILCGFDFEKQYGSMGVKFIEVHHIESHTTKSKIIGEHEVNPIKDLIPICSNCHSIIHREKPAVTIERMAEIIKNKINFA